jgi:hypothetical protein
MKTVHENRVLWKKSLWLITILVAAIFIKTSLVHSETSGQANFQPTSSTIYTTTSSSGAGSIEPSTIAPITPPTIVTSPTTVQQSITNTTTDLHTEPISPTNTGLLLPTPPITTPPPVVIPPATSDQTTSAVLNYSATTSLQYLQERIVPTNIIQNQTNSSLDAIANTIDQNLILIRASTTISDTTKQQLEQDLSRVKVELINNVKTNIQQSLEASSPNITPEINKVRTETDVNSSLTKVKEIIEQKTDAIVNTDQSKTEIISQVEKINSEIKKYAIASRQADTLSAYRDQDSDGISDFDERFFYGTDPNNATTTPGDLSDGEKILRGIDPRSSTQTLISFEDPHERGASIPNLFSVTTITPVPSGDQSKRTHIELSGKALPNSYVTIFIYSTPIIVTIKTDFSGNWSYTLTSELADGNHEVYTAMVDNSGKIVAKSKPFLFIKQAEAITLTANANTELNPTTDESGSTIYKHYKIILALVVLFALLSSIVVIGAYIVAARKRAEEIQLSTPQTNPPPTENK